MLTIFQAVVATGRLGCIHAEDRGLIHTLTDKALAEGLGPIETYVATHPTVAEVDPLQRAIRFAREAGMRLHVMHITSAEGIGLILAARAAGQPVTMEVVPLYLFFSREDLPVLGPMGRFVPGVQTRDDRAALWAHLQRGDVDTVSSDHASYTRQDIEDGWNGEGIGHAGYASIEHDVLLLLNEVNEGRLTLERVVQVMAEAPARLYSLYPRKGTIRVGSDADFTLVDMQRRMVIRGADMVSKAKFTIYEGRTVQGLPVYTIVRGRCVLRNGEIVGQPGYGQLVTPGGDA
jgi:dihydroorotase-like cyclic amidohydrolase